MEFFFNWEKPPETIGTLLKILAGVLWADVTFSWFADINAYWAVRLSKIFKKRSIVIVGGYDVAKVPEIEYGLGINQKSAHRVKYVLENADKILTVDEGLKKDAIYNFGVIGDNIITVPTGYNSQRFKPEGEKEKLVITVSDGNSWSRARLKGLDTFVRSAKILPDVKYIVIGIQGDGLKKLKELASPNVLFIDYSPQNEVIHFYQKAKVYCQLSMREGLPNALCEAMLCECVPVGSDVQGVRTAIDDTGFLVPYDDPVVTADAIRNALKSDKGKESRERIMKMFPEEKRETELIKIIMNIRTLCPE